MKVPSKEIRALLRRLTDLGHTSEYTGGGHVKIKAPKGLVFCASTPSDRRAVRNIVAELKRYGVTGI